ncbi:hypothetical protein AP285_04120 [Limnospira platensis YZ]|nr:hypothetical protein AP285_04120 [Arthrospira platensis YZ]
MYRELIILRNRVYSPFSNHAIGIKSPSPKVGEGFRLLSDKSGSFEPPRGAIVMKPHGLFLDFGDL